MPPLSVRHTPPEATARNHRFLSVGSTAMSAMRPEVTAGPMPRSTRPLQVSADQPPFGFASSAFAPSAFFAGSAFFAAAGFAGSALVAGSAFAAGAGFFS